MYCPKCGQQVTDSMRFCSRCGLPISDVMDWLAGAGPLAVREESTASALTPKRKGTRHGAKIMFLGGVLIPIFFGLSIIFDSPIPLLVPCTVLLAGFSLLLYFKLFGEETSLSSNQAQELRSGTNPYANALPPAAETGVSGGVRQARTSEMAQPHSVTEHTTKLLNNE